MSNPGESPSPALSAPSEPLILVGEEANYDGKSGAGAGADPVVGGRPTTRHPLLLSAPNDSAWLTDLVCLTRSQIEVFSATQQDEEFRSRRGGLKEPIAVGRVGIRCVHCAHRPLEHRARGAVSYPKTIGLVNQAVRNWQRYHFLSCHCMPPDIAERHHLFKATSRQVRVGGASKSSSDYWVECCKGLGLVDTEDGIRFDSTPQASAAFVAPDAVGADAVESSSERVLSTPENAASSGLLRFSDGSESLLEADYDNVGDDGKVGNSGSYYEIDDFQAQPLSNDSASAAAAMSTERAVDDLPPAFTAQDELQESTTLSPIEVAKAEADLRGIALGLASIGIGDTQAEDHRRMGLLFLLDSELAKIPDGQKMVYLRAVARCPEVVNEAHKIAFLEREDFDSNLAAQRLVKYWETKLSVFGPEKCFLPLTLRGAMKDEVDGMLQYCPFQILPVKDAAGRSIVLYDPSRRDISKYSTNSALMALWYMVEAATEDPEVRKKGVVFLIDGRNVEREHFDPALGRFMYTTFFSVSPVACRSIHVCNPSKVVKYLLYPIVRFLVGRENRLRLKMHSGTIDKVLRDLEGFCLPRECVPSQIGGDVVLDLEKWVNDRSESEKKPLAINVLPPAFTAQDELQESITLSPMEVAKAEADMRGIAPCLASIDIGNTEDSDRQRTAFLYHLNSELAKIPDSQKMVYLQAIARHPEMVNDDHKISFLEREGFCAELAAQRLVNYWEAKLLVFGPEKCFLPLTLRGAMKDEVDGMLQYCPFEILPVKDAAGRAIISFDLSRRDLSKYSTNSALMALWYMVEAATEDPEVRKKGIVMIGNNRNAERKHFDPAFKSVVWDVSPVACRSIHVCHPSKVVKYLLYPVARFLAGKDIRLRMKMHYGSTEEVLRELESYCLPRDRVPSDIGGGVVLNLQNWVNERLDLESRREVSRDHNLDRVSTVDIEERATKRMRNESDQIVSDESSRSTGSSPFPTGSYTPISAGLSSMASEAVINNMIVGTTFQGETPNSSIVDDRAGHERRDSFYESIMELPGIEDLGTDDSGLVKAYADPGINSSLLQAESL